MASAAWGCKCAKLATSWSVGFRAFPLLLLLLFPGRCWLGPGWAANKHPEAASSSLLGLGEHDESEVALDGPASAAPSPRSQQLQADGCSGAMKCIQPGLLIEQRGSHA